MSISVNVEKGSWTSGMRSYLPEIKNFVSHLVSGVLIPLLVPVYLCCLLMFYFPGLVNLPTSYDKWLLFAGVMTATVLLPFVLVFSLYKAGIISSLSLYKRSDRFIPQTFSCFLYLALCVALYRTLGATNAMTLAMIANTLSVLAITLVTRYWKISTHAAGAIGFLSIISMVYFKHPAHGFLAWYVAIAIVSITVCFARLYLKAHTLSQIIAGSILGGVVGVAVFCFLP